jgi:hypothetical protein
MDEDHIDPLCIIVVKSGAQGGKLLFKGKHLPPSRLEILPLLNFSLFSTQKRGETCEA